MYATDFEYDGKLLSDLGFIICNFDPASGADIADIGSKLTFNTVSMNKGKYHSLTNVFYEECIQTTFHICKNPEIYDDLKITAEEYRELMRWLNRQTFLKFYFIDEDDTELEPCYYDATFNLKKIKLNEVLFGVELEMITNRPFGYGRKRRIVHTFSSENKTYFFTDTSDEEGYLYPKVTVICQADGDLTLKNTLCKDKSNEEFILSNTSVSDCKTGDSITIDGNNHLISSTNNNDICDRFNYNYFKIGNAKQCRINKISVNLPCDMIIEYYPIIKNTP